MFPKDQPILETERLVLRSFSLTDASEVQRLAGEKDIAATTQNIPHPYEDGMAESWIGTHTEKYIKGESVSFSVIRKEDRKLVGAIGFHNINGSHAEMGYWIGKPYWGQEYATEAARRIIQFGFLVCELKRINAFFFTENQSSRRVMQKNGMTPVRFIKNHTVKWGQPIDAWEYEVLAK